MTNRLIEAWLPIAELAEEHERAPLHDGVATHLLPPRLVGAAVLASLLPADADRKTFMHRLGIHRDPVAAKRAMEQAKRTGIRINNPCTYLPPRPHRHLPLWRLRAGD